MKHFLLALTTLNSRWIGAVDASRLLLGILEVTRGSQQVRLLCHGNPGGFMCDLDAMICYFPQTLFQNASKNRTPRNICAMQA